MKKLIILFGIILISSNIFAQRTIWNLGKLGIRYDQGSGNDTLLLKFNSDTTDFYSTTNPYYKFYGGVICDSIKVDETNWVKSFLGGTGTTNYVPYFTSPNTLSNSPIYVSSNKIAIGNTNPQGLLDARSDVTTYSIFGSSTNYLYIGFGNLGDEIGITDNNNRIIAGETGGYYQYGGSAPTQGLIINNDSVGIGTATPSCKLDVIGRISSSNMETNTTSLTTRLGINSGLNEDETEERENVFIGYNSGYSNTTGSSNVFIGNQSGYTNTDGGSNIFIGNSSGYENSTGSYNVFMGSKCGNKNTIGSNNTFFGYSAGAKNVTTDDNTFVGYSSGFSVTNGQQNTSLGSNAMYLNSTGSGLVCLGYRAGYSEQNSNSIYIGSYAGNSNNGGNNIFIGFDAGLHLLTANNRLIIDNQNRTNVNGDTTKALIYGVFASDPADQKLTVNGYFQSDTNSMQSYTGIFALTTAYTPTAINTWLRIKMDSLYEADTYGFHFNADSTGIVCEHSGIYQFGGHAKLYNTSAGLVTATVGMHLLVNSSEQEEFNTAVSRSFNASGAADLVSAANGFLRLNANDTLYIEMKTTDTDIDLDQIDSNFFDNIPIPLTIFLHEIKPIKK